MGLDISHDAFHGAYSAFNRFRVAVCYVTGGSFPPHWKLDKYGEHILDSHGMPIIDEKFDREMWYWGKRYSKKTHPGLFELLSHSDCDGEISPKLCNKLADEIEALLPALHALGIGSGHIQCAGGYGEVARKFIEGCRRAAAENKPLIFG
jgi:hypothetical protein